MAEAVAETVEAIEVIEEGEGWQLVAIGAKSKVKDADGNFLTDDDGNNIVYEGEDSHYVFTDLKAAAQVFAADGKPGEMLSLVNSASKSEGYSRALTKARHQHPTKLGKRTAKAVESGFAAIEDDLPDDLREAAAAIAALIAAKVAQ